MPLRDTVSGTYVQATHIAQMKVISVTSTSDGDRRVVLREALDRLPRVSLGNFPTPLDHLSRLSALLEGPRILMKREDLSGLAMGGNKARVLEYVLGDAVAKGHDAVVSGAGIQSNLCRQLAAAAAKLGMKATLVLSGVLPARVDGNLLLNYVFGAKVVSAPPGELTDQSCLEAAADDLRREGYNPYVINLMSGTGPLGALAFVDCMLEIDEQLEAAGIHEATIYVTSGSGGTHAGLALGASFVGMPVRVQGVSIMYPRKVLEPRVSSIVCDSSKLLGLPAPDMPWPITVDDNYSGGDYGVLTDAAKKAIEVTARTEGILLDPLYTGKAMSALIGHVLEGRVSKRDTVIFVHTGGTPALFAYGDWLMNQMEGGCCCGESPLR